MDFVIYPMVWVAVFVSGVLAAGITFGIMRHRTRSSWDRQPEYRELSLQSLTAIANTMDAKDEYMTGHSVRVAAYSAEIARSMGMDNEFAENIYCIGLLHDVGKIGIPDEIMNKPGKLTDEEYESMDAHMGIGFEILNGITAIPHLSAGVTELRERWDGRGSRNGLKGEEISLQARIIAVAEAYDAMSSDRYYRTALPKHVILQELEDCVGSQFDPHIAAIVIRLIENGDFEKIAVEK